MNEMTDAGATKLDRGKRCPICHHDRPMPKPSMNGFEMRACPRCRGRWAVCAVDDLPDYDADYDDGDHDVYQRYQRELRDILAGGQPPLYWFQQRQLDRITPFGRRRLLEIGCGNGMFLLAARRAGWEAEGLEASPKAAELARKISECPVLVATACGLPGEGPTYEVVSGFEVLEHVYDPLADLRAVIKRLVPGGMLTLSVPNDRSPRVRKPPDPEGRPPYHINFYQPQTLATVLADLGLELVWLYEKPFAWSESHPSVRVRCLMLPWLVLAGYCLGRKGSRLVAWARKPA
ncbi:MAG: class I SAM-dependent methyltransferase [Phycisphaerae bacterium]|nr:class I SAM-dependent methyltransferase [Phycisphaerae bacterium]